MRTPIQFRYNCDRCEKDCTRSHLTVTDNTPEAVFLGLFPGQHDKAERHFCTTECLLAAVAAEVEAK